MVTIILPVSRPDFLRRIFAQLDMMPCDATQTNLFVYVDGDQRLFEMARNLTVNSKFRQKLCVYRAKGMPDVASVRRRRQRIADIHNEIKKYVQKCEFVFLLEDDTLFPLNVFEKLRKSYIRKPHAGLISGVQLGRWGFTIPGLWRVDNPYDIKTIKSALPPFVPTDEILTKQPDLFEQIDASGFYCMFTPWELYQSISHQPFSDFLGPDVYYGIELRKLGYNNYVDWTINTGHLTKKGEIKVHDTIIEQATLTRAGTSWELEVVKG